MKRFLKCLFLFLLPLIVFAVTSEILLRNIPNDYRNKCTYLNENAGQLSVLILGASHSLTGLNPDYFSKPCYNAAYVSQSIDMDLFIFENYEDRLDQLEYIILPASYFILFERLETISEFWRIKNYVLYYDLNISSKICDHSEILGNKLWYNLYRMTNYYILGKNPLSCSANGWGKRIVQSNVDLIRSGKERAKLHTANNSDCVPENTRLLKTLIERANAKNIRVILYTSPAYESYAQNLNPEQWGKTIHLMDSLANTYENVSYYNFLSDPSFTEADYFDSDHLNVDGAKKLSLMLNKCIGQAETTH
jgi:hypothetical protein